MKMERYQRAVELLAEIASMQGKLKSVELWVNTLEAPAPIFDRFRDDTRAYFNKRLANLQEQFDNL